MRNLLAAIAIIWTLVSFPCLGALGGALLSFIIVDRPALENFTNEEWVSLGAPPERKLLSIQAGYNKGYLEGISGKAYVTRGRILEEAGCWKEIGEIPDYLDIGQ